jgi:hypothetical protein
MQKYSINKVSHDDVDSSKYDLTYEEKQKIQGHKKWIADKEKIDKTKTDNWGTDGNDKHYGFKEFLSFSLPLVWQGKLAVKLMTVFMFILLLISRVGQVIHPLVMR